MSNLTRLLTGKRKYSVLLDIQFAVDFFSSRDRYLGDDAIDCREILHDVTYRPTSQTCLLPF